MIEWKQIQWPETVSIFEYVPISETHVARLVAESLQTCLQQLIPDLDLIEVEAPPIGGALGRYESTSGINYAAIWNGIKKAEYEILRGFRQAGWKSDKILYGIIVLELDTEQNITVGVKPEYASERDKILEEIAILQKKLEE